jgi:hypothetical protein
MLSEETQVELRAALAALAKHYETNGKSSEPRKTATGALWRLANSAFVVTLIGGVIVGLVLKRYEAAQRESERVLAEEKRIADTRLALFDRLTAAHRTANAYSTNYCVATVDSLLMRRELTLHSSAPASTDAWTAKEVDRLWNEREVAWQKWVGADSVAVLAMHAAHVFTAAGFAGHATKVAEHWRGRDDKINQVAERVRLQITKSDTVELAKVAADAAAAECNRLYDESETLLAALSDSAFGEMFPR